MQLPWLAGWLVACLPTHCTKCTDSSRYVGKSAVGRATGDDAACGGCQEQERAQARSLNWAEGDQAVELGSGRPCRPPLHPAGGPESSHALANKVVSIANGSGSGLRWCYVGTKLRCCGAAVLRCCSGARDSHIPALDVPNQDDGGRPLTPFAHLTRPSLTGQPPVRGSSQPFQWPEHALSAPKAWKNRQRDNTDWPATH
ncbi:hypothetical protein EDB80DRAFT_686391 [Ilyonectria destructans]|nr:hypothetical protein EDB80DRAFT_686391 [Ilyonectria destructans]